MTVPKSARTGTAGTSAAATTRTLNQTQRQHHDSNTTHSTAEPASDAGKTLRMPSESAIIVGKFAAERAYGKYAAIRDAFIKSPHPEVRPPLAEMLVGGQGGEVRLKLYLTLLFICRAAPHSTSVPSRAWAELFDLPQPSAEGSRRVRDALKWLETHHFVEVERKAGSHPKVTILLEDGSGSTFRKVSKENGDHWEQLPATMWSKGWIAALSGRAIAMLLILLDYGGRVGKRGETFWVPPERALELYSLSPEMWAKGTAELQRYGILVSQMKYFKEHPLAILRRRKEYRLVVGRLATAPAFKAPRRPKKSDP